MHGQYIWNSVCMMIFVVDYFNRRFIHRVYRRRRGLILKLTIWILIMLALMFCWSFTGLSDITLDDNDYANIDMFSDTTTRVTDYVAAPDTVEAQDTVGAHDKSFTSYSSKHRPEANSPLTTTIEGRVVQKKVTPQVSVETSHDCVEWFEDTLEENLLHIAKYPRGQAETYWEYTGGHFTAPTTNVSGFPVIVTASDYYHNRQIDELYASIKRFAMPKYNVTKIVFYDIGMYPHHPKRILKLCRICEVRKFPFDKFPDHISPGTLKNYAWKPVIIRQMLSEYSWVWWLDASIQLTSSDLDQALQYSKLHSLTFYTSGPSLSVAKHTHPKTFQYMQEDECKFNNLGEPTAGFVLYHFGTVTRTVIDAWAACALNKQCISPDDALTKLDCSAANDVTGTRPRGVCHRFDQSVLGIILRRLFHDQNYYPNVNNTVSIYKIKRLPYYYLSEEDLQYYYAKKLPSFNTINRH